VKNYRIPHIPHQIERRALVCAADRLLAEAINRTKTLVVEFGNGSGHGEYGIEGNPLYPETA
jgi:hypothetical protein